MNTDINKQSISTQIPLKPGVYKILDRSGQVLYVGKAKILRKRLLSYLRSDIDEKTSALMQLAVKVEILVTISENDALLLENTLIKQLKPKYNVLFKDDKSYPYLFISDHPFPRFGLRRGEKKSSEEYYGPYPSAHAAHETLQLLQKTFKVRQCSDVFFRHRRRPCIQYQIKRCSAPCVGLIEKENYAQDMKMIRLFLQGKSRQIIQKLKQKMQMAAKNLDYEQAASYRDQVNNLQNVSEQQYIVDRAGETDVIALIENGGYVCVQVLFIRKGKVIGNKNFYYQVKNRANQEEAFSAFLTQYYLNKQEYQLPKEVLINIKLKDKIWIENALNEKLNRKIKIIDSVVRGKKQVWLKMAETNAEHALFAYLIDRNRLTAILKSVQNIFKVPKILERIECFDISHYRGAAIIASCVVFDQNGPVKADYRRFNIHGIKKGDDYAAIEQALERRYRDDKLPDMVIIDGGKGQLGIAKKILSARNIVLLAIAKGPERKSGAEVIYSSTKKQPIVFDPSDPILHLLQQIRDEAHRFAITGHRRKYKKELISSSLEKIPGIGQKKRNELLKHFGGIREIKKAGVEELVKVPGISRNLAKSLFIHFAASKGE